MLKAEIIGNLGADAEVKEANGSRFIAMRVANSSKWTDDAGTQHEQTEWVDVTYSNVDSKVLPFLKQGVKIFARGNASSKLYSSPKQKKMVAGIKIAAQEIELCGGSSDEVPRQLIDPTDGSMYDVVKYYWCLKETKSLKKDEFRVLVDQRGGEYAQNKAGFVVPKEILEQEEPEQK